MNIERAFQVFELDSKSSPQAIKRRYHDLVAVWHPDRHATNSRLRELASEKMKEINSAYETIRLYLENHLIVACPYCGADNRRQINQNIDYAICSYCAKQLKKPIPLKQRIPCADYRCAGTIGSNRRCNYCGKTIEEVKISSNSTLNERNENNIKSLILGRHSSKFKLGNSIFIGFVFFAFIFVVLYIYYEKIFEIKVQTAIKKEPENGLSYEPNVTPAPAVQKSLIAKSDSQSTVKDKFYYNALFNLPNIKKNDIIQLQAILKTLGYDIKILDGIISDRTILCFKQYTLDFEYIPTDHFPECFFKDSLFHYLIALEHKDWLDIFLTRDLKNWIDSQPDDYRKKIYALKLDKSDTVIQLLRIYKFYKFRPLSVELPETGIVKKNFTETNGHVKIKTKRENNNYFVKLNNLLNNHATLSAFICSGSTLSVRLPFGIYELKYAAGPNWYGLEYLFGTSASYGKLPTLIVLSEKNNPAGGLTIELIPSQYGKLNTEIISEFDF